MIDLTDDQVEMIMWFLDRDHHWFWGESAYEVYSHMGWNYSRGNSTAIPLAFSKVLSWSAK